MDSKPVSVQAMGNDIASKNTELKFNSFAVILLHFENGIIAKLTGNGGCVHPHFHGLKIFGTDMTAIQNRDVAFYLNSSEPGSERVPIVEPYPEKESRQKVIHSFVNYILDSSIEPIVTQQDVYDVMSVCFAAEESMNTGKSISIEYLN
jgi:predicted dehydrogenase